MDQNPQDTDYVIEEPDTSSQGATPVTDETAQETHEQETHEAAEQEAARKRVEDAINSGMADVG